MRVQQWFFGWLVVVILMVSVAKAEDILPPEKLAKVTIEELLAEMEGKEDSFKTDPTQIFDLVEKVVLPHFDFDKMSKLVLARHWREASEAQQQKFTEQFKNLLVRTYSTSLMYYSSGQKIVIQPVNYQPTDRRVSVVVEVENPKNGQMIPLESELYKSDDGWKVFNVKIDGVSMVTNYRSSFDTEIGKKGLDGLIADLVKKAEDAAVPVDKAE